MTRAATSVLVLGVYHIAVGSTFLLAPNTALGILGIAPTTEVWIHILGVLVLTVGLYDCAAARQDVIPYFRWTVWGRALVVGSLLVLTALKLAPAVLLIFALILTLLATWTWLALRGTRHHAV